LDALSLKWSIHKYLIDINENGHAKKINSMVAELLQKGRSPILIGERKPMN